MKMQDSDRQRTVGGLLLVLAALGLATGTAGAQSAQTLGWAEAINQALAANQSLAAAQEDLAAKQEDNLGRQGGLLPQGRYLWAVCRERGRDLQREGRCGALGSRDGRPHRHADDL